MFNQTSFDTRRDGARPSSVPGLIDPGHTGRARRFDIPNNPHPILETNRLVVRVANRSANVHGAGAADQFSRDMRRTVGPDMAIIGGEADSGLPFDHLLVDRLLLGGSSFDKEPFSLPKHFLVIATMPIVFPATFRFTVT